MFRNLYILLCIMLKSNIWDFTLTSYSSGLYYFPNSKHGSNFLK